MIKLTKSNIFEFKNEHYIINPVNTMGIMGKGLAKQFKEKYPSHFQKYKQLCHENKIVLGKVFIDTKNKIITFPTKGHWKEKSNLIDIKNGLKDLHQQALIKNIKTIVMPKIGSGLGGLNFPSQVLPLIGREFKNTILNIIITIYPNENLELYV